MKVYVTTKSVDSHRGTSVYFTSAYGQSDAIASGGSWCTLRDAEGRWQIPLILQELPGGCFEAQSPYGYSGIYIDTELNESQIELLWENSKSLLRELGVVSLFMRFSPFASYPPVLEHLQELSIQALQPTVSVSTLDAETAWKTMEGRARTAIRKAERTGMTFGIETPHQEDKELWNDFKDIYDGTMKRVNASAKYFFASDYYLTLATQLGKNLRLATVRSEDGRLLAACLIMLDATMAHYHLAGSTPEGARNGANNLMIWGVIEWAARQGLSALHLGGGVLPGDSLFKFKSSFGGEKSTFRVGQVVLDPDRYAELTNKAALAQGVSSQQLEATGFFPAFKAKIISK